MQKQGFQQLLGKAWSGKNTPFFQGCEIAARSIDGNAFVCIFL
jgi:hypothetical protein